ncbi:MAG: PilW family protein [Pseudomonadota bacterium]
MRRAGGATLPELMVALAVGLLVLLLAAVLLATANAGYLAQADNAGIDDAGRYALEAIARAVRQAGHTNWDSEEGGIGFDPAAPARVAGLDNHSVRRAGEALDGVLAGAVNGSDVLALHFEGAGDGAEGDGSALNCGGFGVGRQEQGWSIFYVARSAAGEAELRCKYRGAGDWGADALVAGVDSFQVLYGVDTDVPPDGLANQYLNATAIDALDAALALEGADARARAADLRRKTHWKRVSSVKVGLLLHGARHAASRAEPIVYDLFGAAYGAVGDADLGTRVDEARLPDGLQARERKLFAATIALHNPARGGH